MTEPSSDNPGRASDAGRQESEQEQLLAEAVAEFADLQAREQPVDMEDFCRKRPGLELGLRSQLRLLCAIEDTLAPLTPASPDQADEEALPECLSGCRVLGVIGAGGMGRVLLALDEGLNRRVAIKTLSRRYRNDALLRARFMQEARALAQLNHPNIVRIYNLGKAEEIPHFVMEHVTGVPLTEAARALTLEQKADLMRKVVEAVEVLHRNHIIHRDLKPGNILVGPDLEPKLLDFGLARQAEENASRLTQAGDVMGTPDYFSPEQARGDASLDARSDIFSLGTVLYEMITGSMPFQADRQQDLARLICEGDPVIPRRIDHSIPGELQNICLKAMEKHPADRYGSAREMAQDLERFLAGEAVLANPTSYSRIMSGKIEQHLKELGGWQQDRILSLYELDAFRKLYDRLVEREDAWILEVRRLSISQVSLYLGAWILVVAAGLVLLFRHPSLSGTPSVLLIAAATMPAAWIGIRCWKQEQRRIAVAFLLAFCLLLPMTLLVAMKEWKILAHFSQGKESLEFFARFDMFREPSVEPAHAPATGKPALRTSVFHGTANAQLWWAILLSLPAYYGLRRFTGASVFSLAFSVMSALLCMVTLLRMGMLEWLDLDPGRVYFRLIPFAVIFFVLAAWIEQIPKPNDSRYFYPVAVLFTFTALSGVAYFHEPYARWLGSITPRTRGQVEYLFIINAGIYLALQSMSERFGSPQMRTVAKSFRFVIPGHVLTSLLLLGLAASSRWEEALNDAALRREARFFEILLPAVACLFVLGSVPKQMKNFFVSGLLFLAIGITRLQLDLFKERPVWPVSLLIAGLLLMLFAANYTSIKLVVSRLLRR
jgi:serine/threonine-protein kinase